MSWYDITAEDRDRFQCQNEQRATLKKAVMAHGERLPTGAPTPEMLKFMACCVAQVRVNSIIFQLRRRAESKDRLSNA